MIRHSDTDEKRASLSEGARKSDLVGWRSQGSRTMSILRPGGRGKMTF